jgi:hypothetical protein
MSFELNGWAGSSVSSRSGSLERERNSVLSVDIKDQHPLAPATWQLALLISGTRDKSISRCNMMNILKHQQRDRETSRLQCRCILSSLYLAAVDVQKARCAIC